MSSWVALRASVRSLRNQYVGLYASAGISVCSGRNMIENCLTCSPRVVGLFTLVVECVRMRKKTETADASSSVAMWATEATKATKATKPGWETNKIQTKTKKTPKENAP